MFCVLENQYFVRSAYEYIAIVDSKAQSELVSMMSMSCRLRR